MNLGTGQLYKDAAGNVGIGTATPGAKLDVQGALRAVVADGTSCDLTSATGRIRFRPYIDATYVSMVEACNPAGSVNTQLSLNGSTIKHYISGVEKMLLDASGNLIVGGAFGGTAPSYKLAVNAAGTDVTALRLGNSSNGAVALTSIQIGYALADFYGFRIVNASNPSNTAAGLFKIQRGTTTAWADAVTVDNSGNVGLGMVPGGSYILETAGAVSVGSILSSGNNVLTSANFTGYAPSLTGTGASGTWPISISGSAAAVPWSGISSKPTTLAGFGITDGITSATAAATYAALTGATFSGDITAYRPGSPTSGVVYLGNNSGTRYLYYDGTSYSLSGASLYINSALALTAGNFNTYAPTLTGGGSSGTWAISVTGSSASTTGNAATATTATNVSGGSVSATTGTFSGVVKGNSGAKGFGGITTTTVTTAPTGGTSGDFVMVY